VLLSGWVDNQRLIEDQLGLEPGSAARCYGAAVERWGGDADRRLIGNYAAMVSLRDGAVRLSRSPWCSKPLFFHADREVLVASTTLRSFSAAGLPRRLRQEAVDALLAMELPDEELSAFEGIECVPQGAILEIGRGTRKLTRWYDPLAIPEIRFAADEDYVEAANALLAEAVSAALGQAERPGITLSGGLDSPIVADEVLRQLPSGRRLPSFTFTPLAEWDGVVAAHKFGNDRPFVEAFAAMHPGLDPQFTDNRGIAFDDRDSQLFEASHGGYPARVSGSVYHGLFDAAREAGCDWLLTADCGNLGFSNGAPWAYGEFLRRGQWRQLHRLAACEPGDKRPVWRRIAARAIMPELPDAARRLIRRMVHRGRPGAPFANPLLDPAGRLGARREERNIKANIMTVDRNTSRAAYIERNYASFGLGAEIVSGYEQVFGIQLRDVTCYRPLIEFCLGLPTDQFIRDGERRWLARRMAKGRMPEAQRLNRLYGEHNVDWHARLTPRLDDMRKEIQMIAGDPELGSLIDCDHARALLDNWPDTTPSDPALAWQLLFYLPATIYVSRFVAQMAGSNRAPLEDRN
jgi:asparagine synthase (glutamine-hydrolysing)